MKKIFLFIICLVTAVIMGYGIKYAVTPVSSEKLEMATHENKTEAHGYIIRDDSAYYAERAGKLYKNVDVGARVAKDTLIYTIYDASVSNDTIKELNTLDKKIAAAREAQSTKAYESHFISVESEIAARTKEIIDAAQNNEVNKIAQYKKDIKNLRTGEASDTQTDELSAFESQKAAVESRIQGGKSERFAENSGVFTMYYDGFEDVLDVNKMEEYTVEYIESLGEAKAQENSSDNVNEGDFICSVVNNHIWNVILVVQTEAIKPYKTGETVTLRFNNIAGAMQKGTIAYISHDEQNKDGKSLVLIECMDYFEGAYSYRMADVDLIFESYSGYKVPAQAIRIGEDGHHVIGILDNKEYVCAVDVLYTDTSEGYVIVNSANNALRKLSAMDRIVVGER